VKKEEEEEGEGEGDMKEGGEGVECGVEAPRSVEEEMNSSQVQDFLLSSSSSTQALLSSLSSPGDPLLWGDVSKWMKSHPLLLIPPTKGGEEGGGDEGGELSPFPSLLASDEDVSGCVVNRDDFERILCLLTPLLAPGGS